MNIFSNKKYLAVFILVLFCGLFIIAPGVKAGAIDKVAKDLVTFVFKILYKFAGFITGLIADLFETILNFGFNSKDMALVKVGWIVVRDIVNMFFIITLIIIAFATILQLETYGMKALLPKLITVALLINFSYLICGIIIDISQIMANYFINLIDTGNGGIGAALLEVTGATKAITSSERGMSVTYVTTLDADTMVLVNMAFSTLLIGTAGLSLLIGAILLFVRIGALWVLTILAPLAWFFSIFPGLRTHNRRWWSEFVKWSFFAPVYLFFIYLILKISAAGIQVTGGNLANANQLSLTQITSSSGMLFFYVLMIILMFGAPVVALNMGIQGAGAVTKFVRGQFKKGGRAIGRWTSRRTEAGLGMVFKPEKLTGFFAKYRRVPFFKTLGRGTLAWAERRKSRIHQEAEKIPDLPFGELKKRWGVTTDPYTKMAYLEKMAKSAKTPEEINLVKKRLSKNRYEAMGGNWIKDVVADNLIFAQSEQERLAGIKIRQKQGKLTLNENEAKNPEIVKAMKDVLGVGNFVKEVEKMPEKIKEALSDTILSLADSLEEPFGKEGLELREIFADITGRINDAFKGKDEFIRPYVVKMKPEDLSKVKEEADLKKIAPHIESSLALEAVRKLSSQQAKILGENFRREVQEELENSPAWARYIVKKPKIIITG